MDGRAAFLLGDPATYNPRYGYGVRLASAILVWTIGPLGVELGGELMHDRFTRPEVALVPVPGGGEAEITDAQQLYETSAAPTVRLVLERSRLRPYVEVAAGLSWAFFHAPQISGQSSVQEAVPLLRVDAGLEWRVRRALSLRLAGEYTGYFSDATIAVKGMNHRLFDTIADVELGVDYRF